MTQDKSFYVDLMFRAIEATHDPRLEDVDEVLAILGLALAFSFKLEHPEASREAFEKVVGACFMDIETIIADRIELQDIIADYKMGLIFLPKK